MKLNTRYITEEHYPYLLQQIKHDTSRLDVAGTIPSDDHTFLCIIGSRTHSTYGKDVCEKIISKLAGYPIVIVSGLAIGIDSIAHEAALKAGLKTVAFPGSGLSQDVLYPTSRRNLAYRILEAGGALISPFEKHQTGALWTFPTRNKLMAGVSHAVLIIEARQGSGTLGTADYATEFNRDILAVPGNIYSELSYGPHMLIQRGAACITSADDVLETLGFIERPVEPLTIPNKRQKKASGEQIQKKQLSINLDQLVLSPEEKMICSYLKSDLLSATDIMEKTSLSSSIFNITISELEMKNLVVQEGGSYRMKRT